MVDRLRRPSERYRLKRQVGPAAQAWLQQWMVNAPRRGPDGSGHRLIRMFARGRPDYPIPIVGTGQDGGESSQAGCWRPHRHLDILGPSMATYARQTHLGVGLEWGHMEDLSREPFINKVSVRKRSWSGKS